jgi:hypothetical protein
MLENKRYQKNVHTGELAEVLAGINKGINVGKNTGCCEATLRSCAGGLLEKGRRGGNTKISLIT